MAQEAGKTPGYGEIHPDQDQDPEAAEREAEALEEPEGADTHGSSGE